MHVTALILAAGKGVRLDAKVPKPLVIVNATPLIVYSLGVFETHPAVSDVIVAVNKDNRPALSDCIRRCQLRKPLLIVDGGQRRQDSVLNCLKALDPACDMVLVHDSARPFIDHELVSRVIEGASADGACICGVPVKGTIKRVAGRLSLAAGLYVEETIDRDTLWEIQTPQGFKRDVILKAYERYGDADVTDDASLVERLGERVKVVQGSYLNIKITTPEDIIIGQAIAKNRKKAV